MPKIIRWQSQILSVALRLAIRYQTKNARNRRDFLLSLAGDYLSSGEERALIRVMTMRDQLERDHRTLAVHDFGTGGRRGSDEIVHRSVSLIHRTSSIPHWWGILLFRFVRVAKPRTIIELGTNLGVSSAYIQSALDLNDEGSLFTIEGDPTLAAIAREALAKTCNGTPHIMIGTFADILPNVLSSLKDVDLAFIDGHHEFGPTLHYFNMLEAFLSPGAAVIFDDVYLWTRPVRNAWNEIVRRSDGCFALDLAKLGILFPPEKGASPRRAVGFH